MREVHPFFSFIVHRDGRGRHVDFTVFHGVEHLLEPHFLELQRDLVLDPALQLRLGFAE